MIAISFLMKEPFHRGWQLFLPLVEKCCFVRLAPLQAAFRPKAKCLDLFPISCVIEPVGICD